MISNHVSAENMVPPALDSPYPWCAYTAHAKSALCLATLGSLSAYTWATCSSEKSPDCIASLIASAIYGAPTSSCPLLVNVACINRPAEMLAGVAVLGSESQKRMASCKACLSSDGTLSGCDMPYIFCDPCESVFTLYWLGSTLTDPSAIILWTKHTLQNSEPPAFRPSQNASSCTSRITEFSHVK